MMRRAVFAMVFLLAAGQAWAEGCPNEPLLARPAHAALHQAYQLLEEKKPARAEEVLRRFLLLRPDLAHHKVSFLRGMLAYQLKNLDAAQKHLEKAVELYPCFGLAWRNLAVVRYEQKRPLLAARAALKAHELVKPPDPELLHQAAVFYLEAGQPGQALPILLALCRGSGAKVPWLKALVRVYMSLGKWQSAAGAARRLLEKQPREASLWRLSAGIAVQRKHYRQAAADLEVAHRLSPPGERQARQLGDLYRAAALPARAAVWYCRAFGPSPTPEQWETLAQTYRQAGLAPKALEAAEKALAAPTARRFLLLAELHLGQRHYARAAESYAKAYELGKEERYLLLAGQCAWQEGDLAGAEKLLLKAVQKSRTGSGPGKRAGKLLAELRQYKKTLQKAESGD